MPTHLRLKLAGIALTVGGITAAACHLFGFEASAEVNHFSKYASFGGPIHLVLFAGLLVLILGWCERYSVQSGRAGFTGSVAFVCVFLGIICGDLIHCVLEFSVFPVLGSMVPYALPGIAEATYQSAVIGSLVWAGRAVLCIGSVVAAISAQRSSSLPMWTAGPMMVSALLLGLGLLPPLSQGIGSVSLSAFYVSVALLGVAQVCTGKASREARSLVETAAK